MSTVQEVSNPFALMMDPEAVLAAVARSERLARLTSRICRPLDKQVVVNPETAVVEWRDVVLDTSPHIQS